MDPDESKAAVRNIKLYDKFDGNKPFILCIPVWNICMYIPAIAGPTELATR